MENDWRDIVTQGTPLNLVVAVAISYEHHPPVNALATPIIQLFHRPPLALKDVVARDFLLAQGGHYRSKQLTLHCGCQTLLLQKREKGTTPMCGFALSEQGSYT